MATTIPEFQTWTVTEPYLDISSSLGEGPHYEPATNTLRFVDIIGKKLHTVSLTEGPSSLSTLTLNFSIGVTADIEGVDPAKKILVGAKSGVGVLDRNSGDFELLKKYYDEENEDGLVVSREKKLRGNDGAIDPEGRFWIGTMTDFWVGTVFEEGSVFTFDPSLNRTSKVTPVKIPNSLGWSLDNKTLYFTHSTDHIIYAYDYDGPTGNITNKRPFYTHPTSGEPDGFRVDVEGNLWSAVYGESKVLKISPEGKLIGEITLPAKNITCPVFVGTELYITSAFGTPLIGDGKFPGAVFKVDVGVKGREPFKFKIAEGVSELLKKE